MLVAMTKFLDLLYQINFTLHYITLHYITLHYRTKCSDSVQINCKSNRIDFSVALLRNMLSDNHFSKLWKP